MRNAAHAPAHLGEGADHTWNDWSKASFGGDADRQSKFLRLMGVKHSDAAAAKPPAAGKAPAAKAAAKAEAPFQVRCAVHGVCGQ